MPLNTLRTRIYHFIKDHWQRESFSRPMVFSMLLLWLLVNLVLLKTLGIRTGADTEVYEAMAYALLEGNLPDGRLLWYSSYIALLAVIFGLGGNYAWVVAVQILLSGVAAICLASAVRKMSGDSRVAFVAVLLYLAWVKIHQWNIFIYTESFFTSLAVISFAAWVLSRRPWHYGLSGLLIVLTFFARPAGFSFLAGWLLYTLAVLPQRPRWKWMAAAVFSGMGLLLLNFMLKDFVLVESYARGEIIYPDISLGIKPPPDLRVPDSEYSALVRLALFVWYQPGYFLKICLIKLLLFFANVKPYFSLLHNSLIVLLLYPLYYFAIWGYRYFPAGKLKYFLLGFIGGQAITVMLTSNNWDGRFLVPVLPFIFILSAVGVVRQLTKKASSVSERG